MAIAVLVKLKQEEADNLPRVYKISWIGLPLFKPLVGALITTSPIAMSSLQAMHVSASTDVSMTVKFNWLLTLHPYATARII